MCDVTNLEPRNVFRYFKEICDVPRRSEHNEKISAYLVHFAEEHQLDFYQDEMGNVIIYKEATKGYEESQPVMIQGHMDMVAVKTPESTHDFDNDPLELVIDGDWLHAKDTSLGADNGIAVAMALAVLESDTIEHPALECVFTVDEEIGMLGAGALDGSKMKARRIINIDSEDEGILTVGCAGAVDTSVTFKMEREEYDGILYRYTVDGLRGGHSGQAIDQEHANAAYLTARVLSEALDKADFRIVDMEGGFATNVILNKMDGGIIVKAEDAKAFEASIKESLEVIRHEYKSTDPDIRVQLDQAGPIVLDALTRESQMTFIRYFALVPRGVQHVNLELGLTETSLSVGVVKLEHDKLFTRSMIRSSVNSRRDELADRVRMFVELLGGEIIFSGEYGAWEFNTDSELLKISIRAFERQYGRKPEVGAIHAGVEPGKWAEKFGEIDAISMGPDMPGVHSINEKLSIESTERTWHYLMAILAECK